MFLKIPQNSQEKNCARVSFLIKLQACKFIKKETLPQVFSGKFLRTRFLFYRTSPVADSVNRSFTKPILIDRVALLSGVWAKETI